jgi:hypothetical protein
MRLENAIWPSYLAGDGVPECGRSSNLVPADIHAIRQQANSRAVFKTR